MDYLFIRKTQVRDMDNYQYLLVIMDDYSQLLELVPVEECTVENTVQGLLRFQGRHGLRPNATFISDRASYFLAQVLREFCRLKGIYHRFAISYSPHTNGTIERPNREILRTFRSLLSQHRLPMSEWSSLVDVVASILNHLPREQLGNRCPIGVAHNIKDEDLMRGLEYPVIAGELTTFDCSKAGEEFGAVAKFFSAWHRERQTIKEQFRQRLSAKSFTKHLDFTEGDWVLVLIPESRVRSKIQFRWTGPAQVMHLYSEHVAVVRYLRDNSREEVVHTSRLAFYSDSLVDSRGKVEEQFLYDSDQWEIETFKDIKVDDNNTILILVAWKGFTDFEDSWEPLDELSPQVPVPLANYLSTLNSDLARRALQILRDAGEGSALS